MFCVNCPREPECTDGKPEGPGGGGSGKRKRRGEDGADVGGGRATVGSGAGRELT